MCKIWHTQGQHLQGMGFEYKKGCDPNDWKISMGHLALIKTGKFAFNFCDSVSTVQNEKKIDFCSFIRCVQTSTHGQGHSFPMAQIAVVTLLFAPRHAPARTHWHVANWPEWRRRGWSQHLCWPQQPYQRSWGPPEAVEAPIQHLRACFWWCRLQPHALHHFFAAFFFNTRISHCQILALCCKLAVWHMGAHALHAVCSDSDSSEMP